MLNCVIWLCGIRSHLRSSIGPTLVFLVTIAGQTVDVLVAKSPDDGARFKSGHHVPEEFLFRVGCHLHKRLVLHGGGRGESVPAGGAWQ